MAHECDNADDGSEWDYSACADVYDLRPDYDGNLIASALAECELHAGNPAVDIGAGTGKLTSHLLAYGLDATALEPNRNMRERGRSNPGLSAATWIAARGESLPLRERSMRLAAFGSSFNVMEPTRALAECARVLVPAGHIMVMWNHRDLDDPLQSAIEQRIRSRLPAFDYGRRRAPPSAIIAGTARFEPARSLESRFTVRISTTAWLQAWNSHVTLRRQAADRMPDIIDDIARMLDCVDVLDVPYRTAIWIARRLA